MTASAGGVGGLPPPFALPVCAGVPQLRAAGGREEARPCGLARTNLPLRAPRAAKAVSWAPIEMPAACVGRVPQLVSCRRVAGRSADQRRLRRCRLSLARAAALRSARADGSLRLAIRSQRRASHALAAQGRAFAALRRALRAWRARASRAHAASAAALAVASAQAPMAARAAPAAAAAASVRLQSSGVSPALSRPARCVSVPPALRRASPASAVHAVFSPGASPPADGDVLLPAPPRVRAAYSAVWLPPSTWDTWDGVVAAADCGCAVLLRGSDSPLVGGAPCGRLGEALTPVFDAAASFAQSHWSPRSQTLSRLSAAAASWRPSLLSGAWVAAADWAARMSWASQFCCVDLGCGAGGVGSGRCCRWASSARWPRRLPIGGAHVSRQSPRAPG